MSPYRFPKTIFTVAHDRLVQILRETREKAGLTQVEAAKRLGCRQTFLSKIECGERRVDVVEFLEICRAYRVDSCKLLRKIARIPMRPVRKKI